MQQGDFFDETLQRKILRLEKWIYRLQREMFFLKEVYNLKARNKKIEEALSYEPKQTDMFAG